MEGHFGVLMYRKQVRDTCYVSAEWYRKVVKTNEPEVVRIASFRASIG
jgi:hypothetical protein